MPSPSVDNYSDSAFLRNSIYYQKYGSKGHNLLMEYLGNQLPQLSRSFHPTTNVLAFDLETTGVGDDAEIIQFFGRLHDKNLNPIDSGLEVIAKRTKPWEWKAQALAKSAGLGDDVLSTRGVDQDVMKTRVIDYLDTLHAKHGKFQALGSNIRFDTERLSALIGEEKMAQYFEPNLLDTMSLSAFETGRRGGPSVSHGLPAIIQRLGIENTMIHNAVGDVPAAVEAYKTLLGGTETVSRTPIRRAFVIPQAIQSAGKASVPGIKGHWKLATAIAGLGVIGMASRSDSSDSQQIKGIRTPYGPYDTIHGINTSSSLTPFGSGRNIISQFLNEANLPGHPWIRASSLGYTRQEDINKVYLRDSEDDPESRSIMSSGDFIHAHIQRMMMRNGQAVGSEVEVADPISRVQGSIDVLLKGNIPLEIKTVGSLYDLKSLKAAKDTAVSQANAYAIMLGAPYGIVMYTARENQDHYKSFKIPVDLERYRSDVARLRLGIQRIPGEPVGHNTLAVNFKQFKATLSQPQGLIERLLHPWRGTAGPPVFYSQDAVEPIGDYGRTMVAAFREGNAGVVQDLGERAINHGYRNQRRHMIGYSGSPHSNSHPIRSRANRSGNV
jgi:hypothetical protein